MIPTDAQIYAFFSGHGVATAFFFGMVFGAFPGYLKGVWSRFRKLRDNGKGVSNVSPQA